MFNLSAQKIRKGKSWDTSLKSEDNSQSGFIFWASCRSCFSHCGRSIFDTCPHNTRQHQCNVSSCSEWVLKSGPRPDSNVLWLITSPFLLSDMRAEVLRRCSLRCAGSTSNSSVQNQFRPKVGKVEPANRNQPILMKCKISVKQRWVERRMFNFTEGHFQVKQMTIYTSLPVTCVEHRGVCRTLLLSKQLIKFKFLVDKSSKCSFQATWMKHFN